MRLSTRLWTTALWIALSQQSGFTSPNYVPSYGPGQYQSNTVWYVGETKEVVYVIIDVDGLDNYTVALWQQNLAGGATLGPVVNATTLPDVRDSFAWTVDLYEFDLGVSNVFFFWIFEGSAANQGTSLIQVSSAYFNISDEAVPSPSSSYTASAATTSLSSTVSSQPTDTGTTATANAESTTTSPSAESRTSSSASANSGVSTGAGIGIGVGVGIVGLSAIACAVIVVRYKRRKRSAGGKTSEDNTSSDGAPPGESQAPPYSGSPYLFVPKQAPPVGVYGMQDASTERSVNFGYPAELDVTPGQLVELDGRMAAH